MAKAVDDPSGEPTGGFPTTRWSLVVAAADPAASEALAGLCSAYWYPVYAFIRRNGHGPDDALDLTQDYFARLLEKCTGGRRRPGRGRFRSFLLADCSFFLADRRDATGPSSAAAAGRCSRSTPAMPRAASSTSRPTIRPPSGSSRATGRWR